MNATSDFSDKVLGKIQRYNFSRERRCKSDLLHIISLIHEVEPVKTREFKGISKASGLKSDSPAQQQRLQPCSKPPTCSIHPAGERLSMTRRRSVHCLCSCCPTLKCDSLRTPHSPTVAFGRGLKGCQSLELHAQRQANRMRAGRAVGP